MSQAISMHRHLCSDLCYFRDYEPARQLRAFQDACRHGAAVARKQLREWYQPKIKSSLDRTEPKLHRPCCHQAVWLASARGHMEVL